MQGFARYLIIAGAPFTLMLECASALAGTTYIWPGAAPCNTAALQDCINAVSNGDTVEVLSNGPIDEDLSIFKPLTLIAAPGYRPVFAAGRGIDALYNPGSLVDWSLTIDGLTFLQGNVGVRAAAGNATVTLRRLDITASDSAFIGSTAIGVQNYGAGHMTYLIEQNRIRLNDTIGLNGITLGSSSTGNWDGTVRDNRVESLSTDAIDGGLFMTGTSASAPNALVYSNQFSGNLGTGIWFWAGGQSNLVVVNNAFSTHATGITFGGELTLATGNVLTLSAFNNTFAGFSEGILENGAMTGRTSGNLFAYATAAAIHSQGASVTEDHSLFFSSVAPVTLGAGSMIADPKFRRGADDTRLTQGSPAIDAADSSALSTLLANFSLPAIDADGLRRFKGATSTADIGAFEFGDGSLIDSVTAANNGVIDNTQLNGNSSAVPQLVATSNPDTYHAIFVPTLAGFDYVSSHFGVISESGGSAPTPGSAYNVFVPGAGGGAFMHTTAAGNVDGFTTMLNNAYVNGHPERIVLATSRATPLFDHFYGLVYGFGSWFIQEFAMSGDPDFATGVNFHIYAQDPSLNAFVWTAPAAATATAIDHVLLNGEPCGRIYAGNGNLNLHPIGVAYSQNRWSIVNLDNATIPAGAQFYVVVDEAATQFCRYDHIFHDGFEGG